MNWQQLLQQFQNYKSQMISLLDLLGICTILLVVTSFRMQQKYITFNTSSTKYVISTSIATNFDRQFSLYCPVLINTKDSTAQFIPSEQKRKLAVQPKFIDDNEFLYNDYHDGQYWYGIKKSIDANKKDITAAFALAKVIVDEQAHNLFLPLFSLPLTFLSIENLYKCDDVLISYKKTENMVDVTVFSAKEGWSLHPEATWGFRNKDQHITFCRQTYPLGTSIEVNVAADKYCVLNDELKENKYNLEEKDVYTLNDLLIKYTTSLQVKDVNQKKDIVEELL